MKKQAVALFALLLAACSDVTQPAPAVERAESRPESSLDADETAILNLALTDRLFTSGTMNTVGVLSEGRTRDFAYVLFTNGTQSVRREFRKNAGEWRQVAVTGLQKTDKADGMMSASAYTAPIGSAVGTGLSQNFYAAASGSSGNFVTGTAPDALQSWSAASFSAGTQTANDTIFAVDRMNNFTFYHNSGGATFNGSCSGSPCSTQVWVNGTLQNSAQVFLSYHLKVIPPIVAAPISGTANIPWTGTYTWTTSASGGNSEDSGYTYEWQISYDGGASWTGMGGGSSKSLTFTSSTTTSFSWRVRASKSGRTSAWVVKAVAVANPMYAPLQVDPQGETVITQQIPYTYDAGISGGSGTYSYQWYVVWDGSPYHPSGENMLGTGSTQTISVVPGDGNFTLRVHVTSNGQTIVGYKYVTNLMTCGEDYCPVEGD
ncbi:hypothetical protein [Longimicrobium terrae]|uniref:PKD domain-containing protein n=1 Tax=Longimicrobium terrae TaxID=1639882 RepID=A0A841GYK0_9BACT|nr:hypothetical protein [Longimicrobium terrae]MBB4636678.1 hypothetical protein [Longimicrobium terrae]MBB6070798.1 hypothetical protein [Longimicrobium terrae]NNC28824.1 hypothetical protein [Longimicrobium terrae]